jgi:non-heme chloroperoxidase
VDSSDFDDGRHVYAKIGAHNDGEGGFMAGKPVVFVHGLWLHADSWNAWVEKFSGAGYEPQAPGWPGDAETVETTRAQPANVAGYGINDVVAHYAGIIRELDQPPVLIGHSFGGLIVQRLLGQGVGAAGVAIDAAPIKGILVLPRSALKVASIALKSPSNRHKAVSLTEEEFRYGFGNAVSEQESKELYDRWTIPSPGKPLFEAALANFSPKSPAKVNTHNSTRGPLLLTAGGQDHTVPPAITHSTMKLYRHSPAVTELREFADRGHSLCIDGGWETVADAALAWLEQQLA